MTKAEARRALIRIGMTGKAADFLLASAEKHGAGAHLKCDITYAEGLGFVIVESGSGNGMLVDPAAPTGWACERLGCPVTIRHGHGGR